MRDVIDAIRERWRFFAFMGAIGLILGAVVDGLLGIPEPQATVISILFIFIGTLVAVEMKI